MIDPSSDRAVYRQLSDILRLGISCGEYVPGAALPSENKLVRRYGISRNTVRLAMEVLRADGLVVTRHGRGTFVRDG